MYTVGALGRLDFPPGYAPNTPDNVRRVGFSYLDLLGVVVWLVNGSNAKESITIQRRQILYEYVANHYPAIITNSHTH